MYIQFAMNSPTNADSRFQIKTFICPIKSPKILNLQLYKNKEKKQNLIYKDGTNIVSIVA